MLISETAKIRRQTDDNLIPLINVVFLMLIFFMVAGQIQRSDPVGITLPNSINNQVLEKQQDNHAELLIAETGALYLDGQPLSLEKLTTALISSLAKASNQESFSVLVKADANLDVEQLQMSLQKIKAAGLLRITLITQKTEAAQ